MVNCKTCNFLHDTPPKTITILTKEEIKINASIQKEAQKREAQKVSSLCSFAWQKSIIFLGFECIFKTITCKFDGLRKNYM